MIREWRPITGYAGCYEVSNDGIIRSLDRVAGVTPKGAPRMIKGCEIKPHDNGNGYLRVTLKKNGKPKHISVHRAVAQAFIPKQVGADIVNHIDFDRKNNCVDNLEWCSQKENIHHSICNMAGILHKGNVPSTGEKYVRCKRGKYIVVIRKKQYGTFASLDGAIACRGEVLTDGEKALVDIH